MDIQKNSYFVTLPGRALIRAAGTDAHGFLQNLITNDMDLLATQPMIYAHLLTPQGKFLFDFFISRDGDDYLIECEGGQRGEDLLKKLDMYRLRSKVELTLENIKNAFVILSPSPSAPHGAPPSPRREESRGEGEDIYADPRHPDLGYRSLTKPKDMEEKRFETWDRLRIILGVPDGSRDMVTDKSTMIESRMDVFQAVSFTKGCYIGQEITARMHNRGLAKKHLIAVEITGTTPAPGTDILLPDDHLAGEMRSSCGNIGIALIKDDTLEALKSGPIKPLQA